MADLTLGTSDYPTSVDSRTLLSNGNNGNEILSEHLNGLLSAMVNVQIELGTGLKGARSNLAARLNTLLNTNGAINGGTAFPSSPTPVLGQPFYRTDLDQLYVFDSTSQWKRIDGVNDHGLLGGLGDDDHSQYLNNARHDVTARHPKSVISTAGTFVKADLPSQIVYEDEANTFTANQKISKTTPQLQLQRGSSSDNAVLSFLNEGGARIGGLFLNGTSDNYELDDGSTVRVAFNRTDGKMTAGVVPLARMASATVINESGATLAADSFVDTSLGSTDDFYIAKTKSAAGVNLFESGAVQSTADAFVPELCFAYFYSSFVTGLKYHRLLNSHNSATATYNRRVYRLQES